MFFFSWRNSYIQRMNLIVQDVMFRNFIAIGVGCTDHWEITQWMNMIGSVLIWLNCKYSSAESRGKPPSDLKAKEYPGSTRFQNYSPNPGLGPNRAISSWPPRPLENSKPQPNPNLIYNLRKRVWLQCLMWSSTISVSYVCVSI